MPAQAAPPQCGIASFYGQESGHRTANGEAFDGTGMTAAHRSLPFGTIVVVTDMATGRHVTVRINDRGPFVRGRILDLSRAAARRLGIIGRGTARVCLDG
ncbi:MAG: septal ring lytic transglycosylase RlpA family protein [Devosia sp.]|nr:septal ring lytic transglycosylase RlpA family protein [Devosia sp.]